MGLGIPALRIKITLESNPLKSTMLVGGLAVDVPLIVIIAILLIVIIAIILIVIIAIILVIIARVNTF